MAEQPTDPAPTTTSGPSNQQPGNNPGPNPGDPAASQNPGASLAADPNSPTTKATQPTEEAGKKPAEQEDTKKAPELSTPESLLSYNSLLSLMGAQAAGVPKTAVSAAGPEGLGGASRVTGGSNHRLLHHLRALLAEGAEDPVKPSTTTIMGVNSVGSDALKKGEAIRQAEEEKELQKQLDASRGAGADVSKLLDIQKQRAEQERLAMQQAAILAAVKKTTESVVQKMG